MQFRDKSTLLEMAISEKQTDIIKLLIDKGVDINKKGSLEKTALVFASEDGNKDIVELLLQNGADVNAKDEDGNTSLIIACMKNFIDIAKFLLTKDADVEIQNRYGYTAFIYASIRGYKDIVELFLQNGVDVNDEFSSSEYYSEDETPIAVNPIVEKPLRLEDNFMHEVIEKDRDGKERKQKFINIPHVNANKENQPKIIC